MPVPQKFEVKFVEKELVEVKLKCIDLSRPGSITQITEFDIDNPVEGQIFVYENGKWVNSTVSDVIQHYHEQEEPTKINAKRFQTSKAFITDDLQIFLNGIKEKEITIIDSDTIEVVYIRQS